MHAPPVEFYAYLGAFFLASFLAVRMNVRKSKPIQQEDDEMGDEVIYGSRYDANVLPEQEKNHPDLVKEIRAVARRLAAGGKEITTDDIHAAFKLPEGVDPRILGAAFIPRKDWVKGSYRPTKRKEANSRPIPSWQLREFAQKASA